MNNVVSLADHKRHRTRKALLVTAALALMPWLVPVAAFAAWFDGFDDH